MRHCFLFLIFIFTSVLLASAEEKPDDDSVIRKNIYAYPLSYREKPLGYAAQPPGHHEKPLNFREKPPGYSEFPSGFEKNIPGFLEKPKGFSENPPNFIARDKHPQAELGAEFQLTHETHPKKHSADIKSLEQS